MGCVSLATSRGKHIVIHDRYADGKPHCLPALAAELVRLKVHVIVTTGPAPTRAAKEATNTIPIVINHQYRSRCQRVRRQPGTTWWKHHRTIHPCLSRKLKRQTTRHLIEVVPKLSRRPRRRRDFNQPGLHTIGKRAGARYKGAQGAASIPRCYKFQGKSRLQSPAAAKGGLRHSSRYRAPSSNSHPNTGPSS